MSSPAYLLVATSVSAAQRDSRLIRLRMIGRRRPTAPRAAVDRRPVPAVCGRGSRSPSRCPAPGRVGGELTIAPSRHRTSPSCRAPRPARSVRSGAGEHRARRARSRTRAWRSGSRRCGGRRSATVCPLGSRRRIPRRCVPSAQCRTCGLRETPRSAHRRKPGRRLRSGSAWPGCARWHHASGPLSLRDAGARARVPTVCCRRTGRQLVGTNVVCCHVATISTSRDVGDHRPQRPN